MVIILRPATPVFYLFPWSRSKEMLALCDFWISHAVCQHRRFLEADLAAVNRSHTPWLVVGGHRPFYIDSTNAAPGWGDLTVADDLQDALEDLFVQHQARLHGDALVHLSEHHLRCCAG